MHTTTETSEEIIRQTEALLEEVHKLRDELSEEARDHMDLLAVNRRLQDDLESWRTAALAAGEYMDSVGPENYYKFSSQEWKKWAIAVLTNSVTGK